MRILKDLYDLEGKGRVSRRNFLKAISITVAALGLPVEFVPKMLEAATAKKRQPVIWLHFQECTGCTETLLRATNPDIASLILDLISLDYHETVMAAAGKQAEEALFETVKNNAGNYICVVEGGIPTAEMGVHCKIAGHTAKEIVKDVAGQSATVLAVGTCASFGGVQAAHPNPTKAVPVSKLVKNVPVVNIPGCPQNPVNFLGTVLHFLTFKRLPALDSLGRPKFAYGRRVHDHCERRAHFDEGRFAESFGDEGHCQGYCLYKLGCKGPVTYSNCPEARFHDVGAWPVGIGHGCIGCTEPDFWDNMAPYYERLPEIAISKVDKIGKTALGVTALAIGAHAAVGIGKRVLKGKKTQA